MNANRCQIHDLPQMVEPQSLADVLWQRRNRVWRIAKRRWNYVLNFYSELLSPDRAQAGDNAAAGPAAPVQPGDRVRVKAKEEIQKTLNRWNQLNRCSFMEEMWPYCGTEQRVLKRVGKFLDERDYLLKKTKGIIILDNVMCQGTKDFGACDRSCFFFWRDEWVEKIG